jgi:hypothetical protein
MKPVLIVLLTIVSAAAQSVATRASEGVPGQLLASDSVVLDLHESRNDLKCSVTPYAPELGFDLMFEAGYRVRIPVQELTNSNAVTVVLRVLSDNHGNQPVYFIKKVRLPATGQNPGGDAVVDGMFRLGEGHYHIDWLVRDTSGRVCTRFWDTEAKSNPSHTLLIRALAKGTIQPAEFIPAEEEAVVERPPLGRPLNVKVVVNFAPQRSEAITFGPEDLQGLVGILRRIGRDPHIGRLSVVACSLRAQQVIYRQQDAPYIDFPAMGLALKTLNLGVVTVKQLAAKNGETDFISRLVSENMPEDPPDALIFISPKFPSDADVPPNIIAQMKRLDRRAFYLTYNLNPSLYPWGDPLNRVVKRLHGHEYNVASPRDLFRAWQDILSHLLDAKLQPM